MLRYRLLKKKYIMYSISMYDIECDIKTTSPCYVRIDEYILAAVERVSTKLKSIDTDMM